MKASSFGLNTGILRLSILTIGVVIGLSGCKTGKSKSGIKADESPILAGAAISPNLCTALRGNGNYVATHFGSLARIVEQYGMIDALAGGSSSTITMFIYESIQRNPFVKEAQGREKELRTALLLKSFLGYLDVLKDTPEVLSILSLAEIIKAAQAQPQGPFSLPAVQYQQAAAKLQELFSSPNIRPLINPNVEKMLKNEDQLGYVSYEFKVNEIKASTLGITGFKATDQNIFFRQGILSFDGIASAVNRVANFYAAHDPVNQTGMKQFLDACSPVEVQANKAWQQLGPTQTTAGYCGLLFKQLLVDYRAKVEAPGGLALLEGYVDQPIGSVVPSIISTSVISGQDQIYRSSKARYLAGEKDLQFTVPFNSVNFAYWIPQSLAGTVERNRASNGPLSYQDDGKMKKFLSMPPTTWREALKASPAEPGLSPIVEDLPMGGDNKGAGGWTDLSPVQILKMSGCQHVIYVTRRQPESTFLVGREPIGNRPPSGVAELLNLTEPERQSIYVLNAQPISGFSRALKEANAVWCTDWNSCQTKQIPEMYAHSYGGPTPCSADHPVQTQLVSNDPFFIEGPRAYVNRSTAPIEGCSYVGE